MSTEMTDPRPTLEERLRAAYKPLDIWMPNSLLCDAANELARLRAQIIAGVYDATSVGITLIETGKLDRLREAADELDRLRAENAKLREAARLVYETHLDDPCPGSGAVDMIKDCLRRGDCGCVWGTLHDALASAGSDEGGKG
jgi:hypothetical protein